MTQDQLTTLILGICEAHDGLCMDVPAERRRLAQAIAIALARRGGEFPITSVHRGDLDAAGFDGSTVDDATMIRLAEQMADAYVENAFWTDLDIIAEDLGIAKRATPERASCF
jgi:hypothetical protein